MLPPLLSVVRPFSEREVIQTLVGARGGCRLVVPLSHLAAAHSRRLGWRASGFVSYVSIRWLEKRRTTGGVRLSLFAIQTSLYSIKPKVWARGDRLHARTSYPIQLLTLGVYARRMLVDRERQTIELETDWFWFFNRRRVIPFHRVAHIDTTYGNVGTSFGWTDAGLGRTDKEEVFAASLFLKEPEERVNLFRFFGDGVVKTGATGVLFGGDDLIDSYGDQADHFKFFINELQKFLQVPIGGADYMPVKDHKTGLQYRCSACKRPSIPGREKCWMCGSFVEPVVPSLDDGEVSDSAECEVERKKRDQLLDTGWDIGGASSREEVTNV